MVIFHDPQMSRGRSFPKNRWQVIATAGLLGVLFMLGLRWAMATEGDDVFVYIMLGTLW